ncbi:MAG TPA: hypothetical protein VGL76_01645 [Gaiellaceae bacterium]
MARKLTWLYGKRGLLLAIAVLTALLGAHGGGHHLAPTGFFDGG